MLSVHGDDDQRRRTTRPRVLVLTSTFPRRKGDGAPRFVFDLARIAAARCEVTVLAPHAPGALRAEIWDDVAIRRFRYFFPTALQRLAHGGGLLANLRASWLARAQLPCLLGAEASWVRRLSRNTDLVHAHWLLPQGLMATLVGKGKPLVVSIHGSDLLALTGRAFTWAQRWVLDRAHVVTSNSDAVDAAIAERHPAIVSKLARLPMGVDTRLFEPRIADPPRTPGLLVMVGRLVHQKGFDRVIAAMPEILRELPHARLMVVGEGPFEEELRALAGRRGVAAQVSFRGALPHEEVAALLRRASLLVAPSREKEGQGLTVLEAMATLCPVMVTASGALQGLVGEGERGVMVHDGDDVSRMARAMVRALSPEERRTQAMRAERARAFVLEHHAWSAREQPLFEIYARAAEVMAWG